MRYLLDTHVFLWWITDDPRLSGPVRAILREPENEVFFSAASAWEIAIKAQLGRLQLRRDPPELIPEQVGANGFVSLPIDVRHALHVFRLPRLHRDPFDRLLVAQALAEDLPLLTADRAISQYGAPTIW